MPIRDCSDNGSPGYQWGDSGKCYIYNPNSPDSKNQARRKAQMQGVAARMSGYTEKANEVTTESMGSGIKNPQQGYPKKKKKKIRKSAEEMADEIIEFLLIEKSLTEWFREKWVDISRPKPGGGFEPCGRADASTGKYPKCVPASRAARMTPEQIRSAVQRKRRAESTERREGKKPINVSTEMEKASKNVPTNPELYARVKAEAKRKFDVYPSAYANAWLVREYKKRGGGYRTVSKAFYLSKIAEDLAEEEAMLAELLVAVAQRYGKFNEDGTGIWAGYEPAEENDDAEIGVKCANCVLYEGNGVCKIIAQKVEDEGRCRFAVIPDGVVMMNDEEMEEESEEESEEEMEPDDMLSERQQAHYEALEAIAEEYGKWDQSAGADGAHYAPAEANPFKEAGMICANCVYYEGGRGCEIVSGEIEPEAICKLWIINEKLITE